MLLNVERLTAGYGPVTILHDVDLVVEEGEIVCIIGPNGAGKSTVLRAVAGQLDPTGGRISFDGSDVTHMSIADKGRMGLIFIPQGENIFPNLTVYENLEIAGSLLGDKSRLNRAIGEVFEKFPIIKDYRNRPARIMSGGERQMLALSRAMILKPRLVLLDEPSLGLSPLVVDLIFRQIQEMNRQGISFLVVEQNARIALKHSDRAYVIESGEIGIEGNSADLLTDPRVKAAYLGEG